MLTGWETQVDEEEKRVRLRCEQGPRNSRVLDLGLGGGMCVGSLSSRMGDR